MLTDLLYRLRSLFRRAQVDQELHDELAFHQEQESAKLQARVTTRRRL